MPILGSCLSESNSEQAAAEHCRLSFRARHSPLAILETGARTTNGEAARQLV